MISEGSRDIEDRLIDAENSALITGIQYMLKHSNRYFKLTIFHNITVFTVFF